MSTCNRTKKYVIIQHPKITFEYRTKCLHFGRIITVILGRTRRAAPLAAPQRGDAQHPESGVLNSYKNITKRRMV